MLAGQTQRRSERPPPRQPISGTGGTAGPRPQDGVRGSRQRRDQGPGNGRAGQLRACMQDRGRARHARMRG
eukprot:2660736-Pyramimonas_sp.AAC.1